MDKFALWKKAINSKPVNKVMFIEEKCRGKTVLDLGCVRHNADYAVKDPNWLHKKIQSVAQKVIGFDFLQVEVEKLRAVGYNILWGDVTKPLDINEQFDVIVAGDLLEHLSNFEGFFENCHRLLKQEGILIISTPNPFYTGVFYGAAFKGLPLISPEHTCWIDPQCLAQLSTRFDCIISEIYFIQNTWKLPYYIWDSENHPFDILNEKWTNNSFWFKLKRKVLGLIFTLFYEPYKTLVGTNSKLVKYSDYIAVLRKSNNALV
ncbi:MAG: methyltransferase domain-containing protein [Anaerolineales bacterium]|nr:methyltransferase domain-containing protein [Anaerolineales bacterium]